MIKLRLHGQIREMESFLINKYKYILSPNPCAEPTAALPPAEAKTNKNYEIIC